MIVVDPIFSTANHAKAPRCFRDGACHMFSTEEGEAGRLELLAFARRLGLRPQWIQYPGTKRQHFDLVPHKRTYAVILGAVEVRRGWMPKDRRLPPESLTSHLSIT